MKKIYRVSYHARSIKGCFGVNTVPDDEKTPEGIKSAIDKQNANMKASDHEPQQYQIICTRVLSVFDDNNHDRFVCRSSFDSVVEIYPAEPDKTPRYYVMYYNRNDSSYGCECYTSSYDPAKAIYYCNYHPGTYVKDRTGKIIFENPKK